MSDDRNMQCSQPCEFTNLNTGNKCKKPCLYFGRGKNGHKAKLGTKHNCGDSHERGQAQ